ncbi:MAG: hypothetical protein R2821_07015 [Flavobacteriaceae bacterium]
MLQKLFENAAKEEEEDEFDFGTPQMISENEELKQYKKAYDELKKINYTMRNALNHIYANTHYVKGNFVERILQTQYESGKNLMN